MLLAVVLSVPILTILVNLFAGPGESWGHIVDHLLGDYIANSLFLVVVGGGLALLFGVIPAWAVSRYAFPFRRWLEWALVLPMAIPNYLTAYAYAGVFDYGGAVDSLLGLKIDVMNRWGLALVLSASLYPYVYVTTRSFFITQSGAQVNAALLLGVRESTLFQRIALPLARPAVAAGMFLVLMEILSDYGATYHYGVSTFTTGIFRTWFGLGEPDTSVYLSAILCVFVLILILLERYQRRRKGYVFGSSESQMVRVSPARFWKVVLTVGCSIPVFLGFLMPFGQMVYWAKLTAATVWNDEFISFIGYTFLLAGLSALLCVGVSYGLIYGSRWSRSDGVALVSKFATMGYSVPGVIIAVGILIPGLLFDRWLIRMADHLMGWQMGFLINGTIIGLLFAYGVRFLAVSFNPIEASANKIGRNVGYAGQVLGISKWRRTVEINLPLLKKGLLGGALLVFVDVMKELPITLLLKPYGVMTLATKAYEYASDERIAESALPSLVIIAVGLLPVILINHLTRR